MGRGAATSTRPPARAHQTTRVGGGAASVEPARSRRGWFTAALVLLTAAVLGASAAVVWSMLRDPVLPVVTVGDTVRISSLELTVEDASRRVDAVMGVNTDSKPLSGPAMPMGGMPGMGAQPDGQGMAAMPGMAGMLAHGEERIDVSLTMRNTGPDPVRLDPGEFTLVSNGTPVPLLGETTSEMARSELSPDTRMASMITFIIPEGTSPLRLEHPDADAAVLLDTAAVSGDGQRQGGHDRGHE